MSVLKTPALVRIGLSDVIRPLSPSEFLASKWGEEVVYLEGGCNAVLDLFSWQELNELLNLRRLTYPRVRVMKNKEAVRTETFTLLRPGARNQAPVEYLDAAMLNFHLTEGASLIINGVDEISAGLQHLCANIGRDINDYCSANAYAAFGTEAGFPNHWDDHEALILQVSGKKRWRVFAPTRIYPLSEDVEGNLTQGTKLLLDVVLKPGDTLYIPRGFWHDVTPLGEPTLHLTLGAVPPTGLAWLRHTIEMAASNPELRRNLAQFSGGEVLSAQSAALIEAAVAALKGANVQEYLQKRRARLVPHPVFSLPQSVTAASLSDTTSVGFAGLAYTIAVDENEIVRIGTMDREWSFAAGTKHFFEAIFADPAISVSALCERALPLPAGEVKELVRYLLGEGFLRVFASSR